MTIAHWTLGRRLLEGFVVVALALGGMAACAKPPTPAASTTGIEAATLEDIEGQEVSRITLTEQAAERLDMVVDAVQSGPDGKLQVPYSALLYDAAGKTWVYTNPEPLVFVRAPVTVERVEGKSVMLAAGPQPGTKIVTLGAAELLGAELDTAH